jgi:acetyltransferase-like isoleucine patch superfamily enzyme
LTNSGILCYTQTDEKGFCALKNGKKGKRNLLMGIFLKLKKFYNLAKYGSTKGSSEMYLNSMRSRGMKIGENAYLSDLTNITLDGTRPWMIEIGRDVIIAAGVTILTHSGDWWVLQYIHGEVLGASGKVKIGDNCFLGMNSTVLKGVTIGDNVIIGAGSVVNKDIPSNCVAAGNPAKVIMSLDEYYKRRAAVQKKEAFEMIREYKATYGKDPGLEELREFMWLFTDDDKNLPKSWNRTIDAKNPGDRTRINLRNNKKEFENMQALINAAYSSTDI